MVGLRRTPGVFIANGRLHLGAKPERESAKFCGPDAGRRHWLVIHPASMQESEKYASCCII